ncbi:MAG: hypothetical protein B6242_05525 [Anaerolineaceae bacterium 4572_78]|nr:MAG: hypothetical protein B6242_05525 [Anaerolineaceae bacterium 4572_78]
MKNNKLLIIICASLIVLLSAILALAQAPSIHPTFPLLDEHGNNVLESGQPVSTMNTCGGCHDTEYIESHSFHANVGLDNMTEPGQIPNSRAWDISPGPFGKWNPITYRYLTPQGDSHFDMGTADWIRFYGARHVGGGPAVRSRDGRLLTEIETIDGDPETHVFNPETGQIEAWDWQKSGVVEMDCFLCHMANVSNQARVKELQDGNFRWANTATLSGTSIITKTGTSWQYNPEAFTDEGHLLSHLAKEQEPNNKNCGFCHGLVHDDHKDPIITTGCSPERWSTQTTGQIISSQQLADSGMNLAGKKDLSRVWDIHAQRVLVCTDCHYSANNPIYYQEPSDSRPSHLKFDSRRRDINEYLYRPSHQFVKGQSSYGTLAPELDASMRRCESCHSIEATHDWLPYKERHLNTMSCESCHIPKMYSNTYKQVDWTVLTSEGKPHYGCRGIEGEKDSFNALITGYEPILLPRREIDGNFRLTPYNLITSWFWVYGNPERPVRTYDLQKVYFDGADYYPEIITLLDSNGDGNLIDDELMLDTPQKVATIKERLEALGLENPHIRGEIQPYSIHHDVARGDWVTKKCDTCHSEDSRVSQAIVLSSYRPDGVIAEFVHDTNTEINGEIYVDEQGQLLYHPNTMSTGLYVLGHDSIFWTNWLGILAIIGTFIGVAGHGGLRMWFAKNIAHHAVSTKKVYMYTAYERLWHWLQALVIIVLIITGLIIHLPDTFAMFNFKFAVQVHNIASFIVVANAFLAVFYHMASGEIKQYLPEPKDFFNKAIQQALYYIQGIFRGDPHPFEKTYKKKLNPLQQITYLMILNVLLPLQVITGILMWGAQRWPDVADTVGGLTLIAPIHSLIAWLFIAFIITHIYLTTTGHTIFADIKAMITGWEEVEE